MLHEDAPLWLRLATAVAASATVVPLLLWVGATASFRTIALAVALPAVLFVVAVAHRSTKRFPATATAITAGVVGGLLGTIGYDVFRVPFVYGLGLGLLEPIESYGVLLIGSDASSALTGFAGWAYHVANGVGFAITYVLVAKGKNWKWGILWALVLETGTIVSPFAGAYGLITADGVKWLPIGLAYAAHIPYGIAIGWAGQHADRIVGQAREISKRPATAALAITLIALAVWHRPGLDPDTLRTGRDLTDGPSAIITNDRFLPKWLRVDPGTPTSCATIRNDDDVAHTIRGGFDLTLAPGATGQLCGVEHGVARIKLDDDVPFSGGFLITDATIR